ncbi:MAG: hypothetical protein RLZ30_331 [Actinomycetota bacterium]|jgi:uncharacterized membrane protein YhaH (DUF805 family)
MNFIDAIKSGFQNYFNFKGRASRSEFWYWVLFTVLIGLVATTLESAIWPTPMGQGDWMQDLESIAAQQTPLSNILALVLFIPNLSMLARRFHDAGFSAKWLFLQLIPIAYGIFAAIGVVSILLNSDIDMLSVEELMSLVFLVLPIFGLFLAVMVVYLVFALRPSRSFYDGNKYVEPESPSSLQEGTTA